MSASSPLDEYKVLCEFMRSLAALRFLRLTILFGASGGLVGAILSDRAQGDATILLVLKVGALGMTIAFGVMDHAASATWRRMRDRANALAAMMQFQQFPVTPSWSPLGTEGASRYLHIFLALLWVFVLSRGWL